MINSINADRTFITLFSDYFQARRCEGKNIRYISSISICCRYIQFKMKSKVAVLIFLLAAVVAVLSVPTSSGVHTIQKRDKFCFILNDGLDIFCSKNCQKFAHRHGFCRRGRCHCA